MTNKHHSSHDDHPHVILSRRVKRFRKQLVTVGIFTAMSLATLTAVVAILAFQDNEHIKELQTQARQKAASSVAQASGVRQPELRRVVSTLGFSLSYDTRLFTAEATQINNKSVLDSKKLEQPRAYESLTIAQYPTSPEVAPGSSLVINTTGRKNFWSGLQAQSQFSDMTKMVMLQTSILDELKNTDAVVGEAKSVRIGDVDYQRVVVSQSGAKYGVATLVSDAYYFTIQHDRPYWAVITNSTADTAFTSTLQTILGTVTYDEPLAILTSQHQARTSVSLARATFDLPDDTSNVPSSLDDSTLLDVVVRNQPAVVRILAVACGTVELRSGGASVTFDDVCSGGVGSGSIISADGYIATNGHVVSFEPHSYTTSLIQSKSALTKLYTYFVAAGIVTQRQADTFLNDIKSSNAQATRALANVPKLIANKTITIRAEKIQYGVQISNQPIRMSDDGKKISFNDSVINAALVAKDYDAANAEAASKGKADFTHSDVAILKADGSFPTVALGDTDDLELGDQLTAIGFPGYVDGNVSTTQLQTIPTITQGIVLGKQSDAPGSIRQLIRSNVQIAQGNSGGPAFDDEGYQVGLNTYGLITCPDKACFGNGTIRDIADLKRLLEANNITLETGGIRKDWDKALDSYASGDYKTALATFEKIERDYPANYLAPELARDARKLVGSETDTSDSKQAWSGLVTILVIVFVAGFGLIIGVIFAVIHLNKKHKHLPLPPPPTQVI